MSERSMTTTDEKAVTQSERPTTPSTREEGRYLSPPVDIYENDDGLVVLVDLPGVDKDGVDLRVDDDVLSIHGRSSYREVKDPLYSEFSLANYYREFRLSDVVDQARISAELKHGVLTVTLPKAERVRPKRIDVKVEA